MRIPNVGRAQRPPEPVRIESQDRLDDLCATCRDEGRFAFDTEFVMEDRYETEICLLQVATEHTVGLVDPFVGLDISGFWGLVADPEVETVVHAGQEDLALCVQHTGNLPRRVFDVQVAAGLVSDDYPLSLQKLVQATLHIRLHKAKTLTDWRRRPLTAAQMRYAADDVAYLLPVRRKLHGRLERRDRLDWALEEFARFEDMSLYRRAEEDKLIRLKGSGSLKGSQLAVVHEVLLWREKLAERFNRPARAMLRDHLIVEIAKIELSAFDEIRDLRGLNMSDRNLHDLVQVIQSARTLPEEKWPARQPRDTETPQETALIAFATAILRSYSLEHDLSYSLLATKRSIAQLVRLHTRDNEPDRNEIEILRGWRGQTGGILLDEVLSGKRAVRVAVHDGTPVLRVTETR